MQMQELILHVLCRQEPTVWQTCTCILTGAVVGLLLVLVSDHLLAALSHHLLGQRLLGSSSAATQVSTEKVLWAATQPTHPRPRTPSLTALAHALLFPSIN